MINALKKMIEHPGVRKYTSNTGWLFATQGVRLAVGFLVGIWVARYLGPQDFGYYNYVTSYAYIFLAFSAFGTTEEIVKEIANGNRNEQSILSSAFYLRLFAGLFAIIFFNLLALFLDENEDMKKLFLIVSTTFIIQPFEVVDLFNKAKVQIKLTAIPQIIQLIISSFIKIYFISINASLNYFIYVFVLDLVFYVFFLYIPYYRKEKDFIFRKVDFKQIKALFFRTFPLMIVSLITLLLIRLDHLMIKNLLGAKALGYYSSASKIIEIFYLIPILVTTSLFTAILNAKKNSKTEYNNRFKRMNSFLFCINLSTICFIMFFGELIIEMLYSKEYAPSANILKYFSLSILFFTFSYINIRWYIAEDLRTFLMFKSVAAIVINFSLNYILIPEIGVLGAVWASIITNVICFFLVDGLFKRTRPIFFIQSSFFYIFKSNK